MDGMRKNCQVLFLSLPCTALGRTNNLKGRRLGQCGCKETDRPRDFRSVSNVFQVFFLSLHTFVEWNLVIVFCVSERPRGRKKKTDFLEQLLPQSRSIPVEIQKRKADESLMNFT